MADWAGIGEMLQGIGAGFQGKGAQYLAAKAVEDENAFLNDERRREAFVKDMVYTNAYAQSGNWDAVTKRLASRLDGIKTLKGNDFHTKGLLEMAADPARREEFLNETNAFIQAGVMAGDIELPGGSNPYQFGASSMGKDDAGNLFQISQARDPNTGQVQTVMSPVGHSSQQQGGIQIVGQMGMTPGETIDYRGSASGAEAAARGQQEANYASLIEMLKARGANIGAAGGNGAPSTAQLAADKTAAEAAAKAEADKASQATKNQKLWVAYKTARDNFQKALAATSTVPFGDGAKLTAAQQAAARARAQFGLALKRVTRDAGEGTFAKDDREAMMLGVPDIGDYSSARDAALESIDSTVAAGLGVDLGGGKRTIVRRGVDQATGNRVVMYSDGTVEPE